jgi:fused signal recognition particle receptor
MVFWRKKSNQGDQERDERDDKLLHPPKAPAIEPSTDYDPAPGNSHIETEAEIIDELEDAPVPDHILAEDEKEAEELSDHTEEGGWLSRLTRGLSKSTSKLTTGISDLLTKSKLDQDALDRLEEILIEADLGPKTAAKVIAKFAEGRFGQDITEEEVREALATTIEDILKPVAKKLTFKKPNGGPMTILVCGVNGVGKTTTIGKLAQVFKFGQHGHGGGHSVMMAAGDTFRAAAVEQLEIWAKRTSCKLIKKDIGADAAAVAFEAWEEAKKDGTEILMIDTAGRLQNKKNLMAELEKIVRVLKKQDETIPHEVLLVLDSTTGQNAFSQVEVFKEMVNVTGLIVTKLDGSAKGGVLVGLADRFGIPVYAIGVGEGVEDMQPFNAREFARALVGLEE